MKTWNPNMIRLFCSPADEHEPCDWEIHEVVGEGAAAQHAGDRIRPRPRRFIGQRRRQACHRGLLLPWLRRLPCSSPKGVNKKGGEFAVERTLHPIREPLTRLCCSEKSISLRRFASLRSRIRMCCSCKWTMRSTSLCATASMSMSYLSSGSTGELRDVSAASAAPTQL